MWRAEMENVNIIFGKNNANLFFIAFICRINANWINFNIDAKVQCLILTK